MSCAISSAAWAENLTTWIFEEFTHRWVGDRHAAVSYRCGCWGTRQHTDTSVINFSCILSFSFVILGFIMAPLFGYHRAAPRTLMGASWELGAWCSLSGGRYPLTWIRIYSSIWQSESLTFSTKRKIFSQILSKHLSIFQVQSLIDISCRCDSVTNLGCFYSHHSTFSMTVFPEGDLRHGIRNLKISQKFFHAANKSNQRKKQQNDAISALFWRHQWQCLVLIGWLTLLIEKHQKKTQAKSTLVNFNCLPMI